ncbi:MAG: hypothetical protein HZB51_28650 [Chloroflexi bacterium]|nr:hypothetical protein [Chloroflexota bacterium]
MAQNFNPTTDGFAFVNYWTLDQATCDEIRDKLNQAVKTISNYLPLIPAFAPYRASIQNTLNTWVSKASTQGFGLCGGMAFAALDYFKAGRVLPSETGPTEKLSEPLRQYILNRMRDSFFFVQDGVMHNNLGRVLAWMAVEHLVPFGKHWLRSRSEAEFQKLQDLIAAHGAWPIALIGESKDPCMNHQVLAYKCASNDTQNFIYIYDMNHPGAGHMITLDFNGSILQGSSEFTGDTWTPLRCFFCEDYAPVIPPI